jgi:hypothetical protein
MPTGNIAEYERLVASSSGASGTINSAAPRHAVDRRAEALDMLFSDRNDASSARPVGLGVKPARAAALAGVHRGIGYRHAFASSA